MDTNLSGEKATAAKAGISSVFDFHQYTRSITQRTTRLQKDSGGKKSITFFSKTLSLGPEAVIKRGVFQPPGQQNGAFVEIVFCPQDGSGVFGS